MEFVIVTQHPAAQQFIRESDARFAEAPAIEGDATSEDVRGRIVAGNLPLHLASLAKEVVAVEFAGKPPRGREYTYEDMVAAGARLASYVVMTPKRVEAAVCAANNNGDHWCACAVRAALEAR